MNHDEPDQGSKEARNGPNDNVCRILERIAETFLPESDERRALRDAAVAIQVVQSDDRLKASYEALRFSLGTELTDDMRAKLEQMGLEPDFRSLREGS
jgi:hypothetical protein